MSKEQLDEEDFEYEYVECPKHRYSIPRGRICPFPCWWCWIKNHWIHFIERLRHKLGFCYFDWYRIYKVDRCKKHYDQYCEANADSWLEEQWLDNPELYDDRS